MFKSRQYRTKAAEYGELVKSSTSPNERRDFQQLEQRFTTLADNEQGLAEDHDSAVHVADQDCPHDAALAEEEEYVLRCLGAAVIMQWDALPTSLRREIFDTAGSLGKLMETVALRGKIARFLHKHKTQE
jgi:hypothetical protein